MQYPFYKKHKTQNLFWCFKLKKWINIIPDRDCIIINFRSENIHPSLWEDSWFHSQNVTIAKTSRFF